MNESHIIESYHSHKQFFPDFSPFSFTIWDKTWFSDFPLISKLAGNPEYVSTDSPCQSTALII